MFEDIRFAMRFFLSSPGFTAAAVLSLAIDIGANSSIAAKKFQSLAAGRRGIPADQYPHIRF
jgi:hypothetical protein